MSRGIDQFKTIGAKLTVRGDVDYIDDLVKRLSTGGHWLTAEMDGRTYAFVVTSWSRDNKRLGVLHLVANELEQ